MMYVWCVESQQQESSRSNLSDALKFSECGVNVGNDNEIDSVNRLINRKIKM
jgi:hypothetical protein